MNGTSAPQTRSGYQVAGTALTAGAISSLLAPWITVWVSSLSARTGVVLGENYADQVLGLTVALISWGSSYAKMWWIERADRQATAVDLGLPSSSSEESIRVVQAENDRADAVSQPKQGVGR